MPGKRPFGFWLYATQVVLFAGGVLLLVGVFRLVEFLTIGR